MLAYTFYENDGRVMRYAEALAGAGAEVEAIVLRREGQAAEETLGGVKVLRVQERTKNERGKHVYFARISKFFLRSMAEITRRHLRRPYDLIHVHSVPDFEVFAAFLPKLMGARVILDVHDIVPEFYAAKFGVGEDGAVVKALRLVEKASASFADHVIIANHLWLEKITSRSVPRAKCSAYINYPDLGVFDPARRTRGQDGRFIVLYPGTLNHHQGLDIAVDAFASIAADAPRMELHIYGEGPARQGLAAQVARLGLEGRVRLEPPRPLKEIAAIMADADLGVVPKRNDGFGGDAFSTKTLEFMAAGVPIVVADTRVDTYYFDDSVVRFFHAGDPADLARAMLEAYRCRDEEAARAVRALDFARRNSWDVKKADYLDLVGGLVGPKGGRGAARRGQAGVP
jgi:glycosyltransferase involved in cell wall biosynthesis